MDAAVAAEDALPDPDTGRSGTSELPVAAAVAAAVALDAAVQNAKDCIQILGGIGFTWEHDAHFYLRRAVSNKQFLGGSNVWRARVTELTRAGARRHLTIDLSDLESERAAIRDEVAALAAVPDAERRVAVAESGYAAPHWPRPYGRGASAAEQILIAEEMAAAGVERPDLVIGWWAGPDRPRARQSGADRAVRAPDAARRDHVVPAVLRARRGLGPGIAADGRGEGRRRLEAQRPEGVDVARPRGGLGHLLGPHRQDAPKHKGITYFVLDMKTPGIRISPLREITGDALFNEVFLDDVFIPDDCVVGEVNGGWKLARTTLANERVAMSGGSSLGKAVEDLLELAGEPDAVTADHLGALISEALVGSLLELRTTLRQLDGQDPGPASSVRKLVGVRNRQGSRSSPSSSRERPAGSRARSRASSSHPLPVHRGWHHADPAHRRGRAVAGSARG